MLRTWSGVRTESFSLKECVKGLAFAGLAALLAQVQPLPGLAPFALALLAAGIFRAMHPLALLAGCLTGVGGDAVLCLTGAAVTVAAAGTLYMG